MKIFFSALAALGLLASIHAAEPGDDEVVAVFRDRKITFGELKNADARLNGISRDQDRSGYTVAIVESTTAYCTELVLNDLFARNNISVGKETAEKCIAAKPEAVRKTLESFVDDPAFQKKCAIRLLLEKLLPREELTPNRTEIENFYHNNQMKFRTPANEKFAIIAIPANSPDAAERAAEARARLLQGEKFERVAAEFDPQGAQRLVPDEYLVELQKISATMPEYSISDVITIGNILAVINLQERTPAKIIPLQEVEAQISEELSATLEAIALQKIITPELSNIRFEQQ